MTHICAKLSFSAEQLSEVLFAKTVPKVGGTTFMQVMLDYYTRAVLLREEEKMPEVGYSRHLRVPADLSLTRHIENPEIFEKEN